MHPKPIPEMENSFVKLETAVSSAARACELATTQGAMLAGAWQWAWHPVESSEDSKRIEVLATPEESGIQVTVQALLWQKNKFRRSPKRHTYFSQFYPHGDFKTEQLAKEIEAPLKKALDELPTMEL